MKKGRWNVSPTSSRPEFVCDRWESNYMSRKSSKGFPNPFPSIVCEFKYMRCTSRKIFGGGKCGTTYWIIRMFSCQPWAELGISKYAADVSVPLDKKKLLYPVLLPLQFPCVQELQQKFNQLLGWNPRGKSNSRDNPDKALGVDDFSYPINRTYPVVSILIFKNIRDEKYTLLNIRGQKRITILIMSQY